MDRADKFLENSNLVQDTAVSWRKQEPSLPNEVVVLRRLFKDGSSVYGVRQLNT